MHLRKVVCSCGTNGLSPAPALMMRAPSVTKMAALICRHVWGGQVSGGTDLGEGEGR
jgi:hypothetical protein